MASTFLCCDTTGRLLSTCAPIALTILFGVNDVLADKSIPCVCKQNVIDFRALLVSAVEEAVLRQRRLVATPTPDFLLQAQDRALEETRGYFSLSKRSRSASCWIRAFDSYCGTEDLLDLSHFMSELKDMGCDCARREIRLTLLSTPSLAAVEETT